MSTNPYAAPKAAVSDVEDAQEFQEVRFWSASGRIGRLRYLAFTTGAFILAGILIGLAMAINETVGGLVTIVAYIAATVFSILAMIQRSHDMDWTGWTILLSIIPLVGLIWIFKSGSPGSNRWGAPPPPNTTGIKVLGLLLPAIALIGILAAIAIPAYVEYQNRAGGISP
jgi:uncharacterized membrane protein YhaH (DUF805 family)